MKKYLIFFSVTMLLLCITFTASGQNRKQIEEADALFENQEFFRAAPLYSDLFRQASQPTEKALFANKAGDCFSAYLDFENAAQWYETSLNAAHDAAVELKLADMLLAAGKYEKAQKHYRNIMERTHDKTSLKEKEASCTYAINQIKRSAAYEIVGLTGINTFHSEYAAIVSNGYLLYSSSGFSNDSSRMFGFDGQGYSDLYLATYDSLLLRWSNPKRLPGQINGKFNEGTACYLPEKNELFFTRCNGDNGKARHCQLMHAVYYPTKNSASQVSELRIAGTTGSQAHAALNASATIMAFVSDQTDGAGGKDIYFSLRDDRGNWLPATNAGLSLNTSGNEMFPVWSGDTMLYFASDGRVGMGGLDIFYVKMSGAQTVGEVQPMPWPVNTAGDDFAFFPLKNQEGIFSSNRSGGKGHDDLYMCRPAPFVLTARGKVNDKMSGHPIAGAIIMVRMNGEVIDTTTSDESGVYYLKDIVSNQKYELQAVKEGYIPQTKLLDTHGETKTRELSVETGHDIDFQLFRITRDEIVINNIYYDFDKWDLREESKRELDKIVSILTENPEMKIQINSHTDDRGFDDYNQDLSQKRAESVVQYLIASGIEQSRLLSKGWGESKLLVASAQSEEEHQLNRRTTFNLVNAGDFGSDYYEKIYADIDRGMQKTRVSVFFRIFIGSQSDEAYNENLGVLKALLPNAPVISISEDGSQRNYAGAFIFMDEAIAALHDLEAKGLKDCYIAAFRQDEKIGVVKLR